MLTGWVLGTGPCGPNCDRTRVGTSTLTSRKITEQQKSNDLYFGNFTVDYAVNGNTVVDIVNTEVHNSMTETVLAVNENAKWEQEIAQFSFTLPDVDSSDINFDGLYWRQLTKSKPKFHLQSKTFTAIRNDTNMPNRCPQASFRPFYRVKLNTTKTIKITTTDPDFDHVNCSEATFVESDGSGKSSGVVVHQDCTVDIVATAENGYAEDTWLAVKVTLKDFNKNPIVYGDVIYPPFTTSIAPSVVQFAVNVLEEIDGPVFVSPTPPSRHQFIVFAGAEWNVELFAKASINTTIHSIQPTVLKGEAITWSTPKQSEDYLVSSVVVSWYPTNTDTGVHIICVHAEDNTGDLKNIRIVYDETRTSKAGSEFKAQNARPNVYKVDISIFAHNSGRKQICLVATDINNVKSERVCIWVHIEPDNPCISAPCKNSALCLFNKITGAFRCQCKDFEYKIMTGENCDTPVLKCTTDNCKHGTCVTVEYLRESSGISSYCYCRKGYGGLYCDQDECKTDPCNGHGVCDSDHSGAICTCSSGYSGAFCNTVNTNLYQHVTDVDFAPPTPKNGASLVCYEDNDTSLSCNIAVSIASSGMPTIAVETPESISATKEPLTPDLNHPKLYQTYIKLQGESDANPYICLKVLLGKQAASPNPQVKVFPAKAVSNNKCVTEASFTFSTAGKETICFQSAQENYQQRCFVIHVHQVGTDPCLTTTPCKYDGHCLRTDTTSYICECSAEYTGTNCEKELIAGMNGIAFTDAAKPSVFTCVVDNPCDISLVLSVGATAPIPTSSNMPKITIGYLDPELTVNDLNVKQTSKVKMFDVEGTLTGTKVGLFDSCVRANYRLNDGSSSVVEHCFRVDVTSDLSLLYDRQDRPHFIAPSLSTNSKVVCTEDKPCHVFYHVTAGDGNNGKCISWNPTPITDTLHYHVFSTCAPCTDGDISKSDCKLDISIDPPPAGTEDVFCIRLKLRDNDITGEKRCFHIVSQTTAEEIQSLSEKIIGSTNMTLISDMSIPDTVTCMVEKLCTVPFKVMAHQDTRVVADEVCITVIVKNSTGEEIDYSNPYFYPPTLPDQTEVICQIDNTCHIVLYFSLGDAFGHPGACPNVQQVGQSPIRSLHIFNANVIHNKCVSEVAYIFHDEQTPELCVQLSFTGIYGERRCYYLKTVADTRSKLNSPCKDVTCYNKGQCIGNPDASTVKCICRVGYTGSDCNTESDKSSFLPGVENTASLNISPDQRFGIDTAIPRMLPCLDNSSCYFYIPYVKNVARKPFYAYIDPLLTHYGPSTLFLNDGPNFIARGSVQVKAGSEHRVCLQTTSDGTPNGINVDEICVHITGNVQDESVNDDKPHFLNTMPNGTVVSCFPSQSCHLFVVTSIRSYGKCDQVTFCDDEDTDNYIFASELYRTFKCWTEIVVAPGNVDNTQDICLLAGYEGEERHFTVQTVDRATTTNPCKTFMCLNNGVCKPDLSTSPPTPVCFCTAAFEGTSCSSHIATTSGLNGIENLLGVTPGSQNFMSNGAVPKNIICEENSHCCVYIPYYGDVTKPPILGYYDETLSITKSRVLFFPDPNLHRFEVCVNGTTDQTHRLCLRTTTDGTQQGINIDEMCIEIEFNEQTDALIEPSFLNTLSNSTMNEPSFVNTLSNGTTVSCVENSLCHMQVVTKIIAGKWRVDYLFYCFEYHI
ncbi:hypothetical protein ACF0H5_002592 [Mactra antiquata]